VLGFSGDIQFLLSHGDLMTNHFVHVALKITVAWGYCMLVINAVLTGGIAGKIMCVSLATVSPLDLLYFVSLRHLYKTLTVFHRRLVARNATSTSSLSGSLRVSYKVVVEAIIESALINLVGILLYEIATVAPTGKVEVNF
jgi:hypothetical protein